MARAYFEITSIFGLDSIEDPVAAVIGSIPNISMVHLGQELLLAVFYSRTLFHEGKYSDKNLQMLCSSCGKLCICRATKHSKLLWLGNVGNTANVTFSEVDSWIPNDWWW